MDGLRIVGGKNYSLHVVMRAPMVRGWPDDGLGSGGVIRVPMVHGWPDDGLGSGGMIRVPMVHGWPDDGLGSGGVMRAPMVRGIAWMAEAKAATATG